MQCEWRTRECTARDSVAVARFAVDELPADSVLVSRTHVRYWHRWILARILESRRPGRGHHQRRCSRTLCALSIRQTPPNPHEAAFYGRQASPPPCWCACAVRRPEVYSSARHDFGRRARMFGRSIAIFARGCLLEVKDSFVDGFQIFCWYIVYLVRYLRLEELVLHSFQCRVICLIYFGSRAMVWWRVRSDICLILKRRFE